MAVSADYATPVMVNGYVCKNCTDVDNAKKHIDPAHPKDGPYGVDAKAGSKTDRTAERSPSVTFGGQLAGLSSGGASRAPSALGVQVDLSV